MSGFGRRGDPAGGHNGEELAIEDRGSDVTGAAERIRGLAALAVIAVLVVGVPWALWQVGGAPWPSAPPSLDSLTAQLGAEQVMSVLGAILWLAWLHFVVCLAVEVVSARSAGSRHVPGGGVGTQSLARRLVASVLLLVGSASIAIPTASAIASAPVVAASTVDPSTDQASVGHSAHAGGSARSKHSSVRQEVRHVARASVAGPGVQRQPVLGLHYLVQPHHGRHYDSLWDISERYLGDGLRWKEIYALNKGVEQPDGSALQDPDLIYPGWVLHLPDDAKGPGVITVDLPGGRSRDPGGSPAIGGSAGLGGHSGASGDGAPRQGSTQVAALGPESTLGTAGDLAAQLGVGGGLVAAGLLFGLKRRRGWNGGPRGGGGLKPDDEVGLRLAADLAGAAVVDTALRHGAAALAPRGSALPPIRAVHLDPQCLSLAFAGGAGVAPPPGWQASPDGRTWTITRVSAAGLELPAGALAPCPGLVSLGSDAQGRMVLVDLERAPGLVAVTGSAQVAADVAASLAAELVTHRWSATTTVSLIGFVADLAEVAPERVQVCEDLDALLATLTADSAAQQAICLEDGLASVRQGRQRRPDPRLWGLRVVVLASPPTAVQAQCLAELVKDPRRAVAAVVVGDVAAAAWRLEADDSGRLTSPLLGIDVAAARLRPDSVRRVVTLMLAADSQRAAAGNDVFLSSVPGFDPAMLEPGAPAPVSVRLLGPLRIEAPGPIEEQRRQLASEIVAYVALNPAGVHPSVLAAAVWPRGVTDEVFAAATGHARRWLGTGATGRPRLGRDAQGRWRLDLREVRVDWHVFTSLVERASLAEDAVPDLAAALSCVEGPAFEDLPAGRYTWLARSSVERDMAVLVASTALRLAALAVEVGNEGLAHEALRTGLDMLPGCEQLWREELRRVRADDPGGLTAVVEEMYAALDRHGSPRGAEPATTALVEELLPGHDGTRTVQIA